MASQIANKSVVDLLAGKESYGYKITGTYTRGCDREDCSDTKVDSNYIKE